MSGSDLLLVIASVITAVDGTATIDRGLLAGLRTGDRATITYELTVAGEGKRIEAGEATVSLAGLESAVVAVPKGRPLGTAHRLEFKLPAERIAWDQIVAAAPEDQRQEVLDRLVSRRLEGDPELSHRVVARLGREDRLQVPAGTYRIGLPIDRAERYDQQPAFDRSLRGFAIDRRILPETIGLPHGAAAAVCARRGGRLPTEFEWEAASRRPGFDLASGYYEWTSSVYRPYPGNDYREDAYDESHLVLRGDLEPDELTPHRRRFLQPTVAHEKVAARCARELD